MPILDDFKLDGQVALVTGANRGIGHGLAEGLAEAGADIVGLNRSGDPGPIQDTVSALGGRYHHIHSDLVEASVDDLHEIVSEVQDRMGRFDILVNNAGIIRRGSALNLVEADWDDVLQVNLKAAFFLSQAAGRHMIDRGRGKIIQVASMLSFQGGILVPSYTAAKHALAGITKTLANEWAPYGVNVNAIAPGYIATDVTEPLRQDEVRNQSILDRTPAGCWGRPADLKGAAVFLASAASNFVHGAIVPVDGGWLGR